MVSAARLLVAGALLLALSACASTESGPTRILGQSLHTPLPFPAGYEVQASLQLSRDGLVENYLLAMSTTDNSFSAAFLSPQGFPVYTVIWRDGRLHSNSQTTIGELLNPMTTVHYLALIFISQRELAARIQRDWNWRSGAAKREFYTASGDQGINIDYRGEEPWPRFSTLHDTRSSLNLTVRILEASLVLPQ